MFKDAVGLRMRVHPLCLINTLGVRWRGYLSHAMNKYLSLRTCRSQTTNDLLEITRSSRQWNCGWLREFQQLKPTPIPAPTRAIAPRMTGEKRSINDIKLARAKFRSHSSKPNDGGLCFRFRRGVQIPNQPHEEIEERRKKKEKKIPEMKLEPLGGSAEHRSECGLVSPL
ncbi:uncharacterized protein BO66DRAFT_46341 [Aspergillus aculeatinus CBS 121060]|uniref:Uncharacterized protein n=1 Tax=Aspergillus aculeatinus CBS 121060 TaxID=1448322 RepID=A0ACD1HD16_9EURO|nr:hypothetical protein BO66DRAFT_46341 [Aspergillus aculeatinus CBS 121060]RAH71676.1 hypothetical protein BO66DRAFT_46341 [Aspergillus aculeatinus CBS 121060]